MLEALGIVPGSGRLHPRPLHCETFSLEKGRKGDGHRDTAEVSIFIDPVKLAQECEDDKNVAGCVVNGVLLIQRHVSIMI